MTSFFDKAAVFWDKDPGRMQMVKTIADAMINTLHPEGTKLVMDYSTGTGNIALRIAPHVRRIIAVDLAQGMLVVLKEKLQTEGITTIEPREWSIGQNIADLPVVDLIVSSMTLHHVRETAAAARTFHELLRPGGKIAIADLDCDNGEFQETPGIAEHDGIDRKNLQQVCEQAGFDSVRFSEGATIHKISSRRQTPGFYDLPDDGRAALKGFFYHSHCAIGAPASALLHDAEWSLPGGIFKHPSTRPRWFIPPFSGILLLFYETRCTFAGITSFSRSALNGV
ncbi:MAG: methyltransferase [Methanoregula sp.]|jgi:SAM-dependent methyltransferase